MPQKYGEMAGVGKGRDVGMENTEKRNGLSQTNGSAKTNKYELRQNLTEMLDRTMDDQDDLLDLKDCRLTDRLKEIDKIFKNVQDTCNGLIDYKTVSIVSNVCKEQSKQLAAGFWTYRSGDVDDTIVNFYNEYDGRDDGLTLSGFQRLQKDLVLLLGKQVPSFRPIFGSFEPGERPRTEQKQRQARRKGPNSSELTQPVLLTGIDQRPGGETIVERINRELESLFNANGKKPVSYFDFILHPSSFSQTVENMFHLAFLVKDFKVKLYMGPDGLPYIEPIKKHKGKKDEQIDDGEKSQFIMTIGIQEWEDLVKVYNIREPFLKFDGEDTSELQRIQGVSCKREGLNFV